MFCYFVSLSFLGFPVYIRDEKEMVDFMLTDAGLGFLKTLLESEKGKPCLAVAKSVLESKL